MNKLSSKELRNQWIKFYEDRGHLNIGAVSLIGDGSTGVMFNVAGMQPLMPYLLGQPHPSGKTRLCNVQGCVRTVDIESVGDAHHCTFFEMMGNWSLGDYFKKEKTAWTFEFLTKVLGFDKNKICASVFAGDENAPRDEETAELLRNLGLTDDRIFFLPKKDNWWELEGTVGTPCGPDNEWFYPRHDIPCCDHCDITCDCGRWVEIGNDVYMQYKKLEHGVEELANKNVDTGFGFERVLMYINGLDDVYKTDLYASVIAKIEELSGKKYGEDANTTKAMRILADHTRTSVMLIGDKVGVLPSNVGAGYILRRIMRRAIRYARTLGVTANNLTEIAKIFINEVYAEAYPNLKEKEQFIYDEITKEAEKFSRTLEQGIKEFDKVINGLKRKNEFMKAQNPNYVEENVINGKSAFRLFDTFGFPLELTVEMAQDLGFEVDQNGFKEMFKHHQEVSKGVAKGEFKSGLSAEGDSAVITKYHTATHLLNAALKLVLGRDTHQMGSNITAERLRFDFNCDHKLTPEEQQKVTDLINGWIADALEVSCKEMPKMQAVEEGAEHQFLDKYPDVVTVYDIGQGISKEICTGPHVNNTKELGKFEIIKEEASSNGVRRIKAVLK